MGSCIRRRWRGAHAVPPQPFQQKAAGLFGADPAVFGKVPLPVPGFQGGTAEPDVAALHGTAT